MHTELENMAQYKKNIDEALNDTFLRKTLNKFAVEYRVNRDKLYAEIPVDECIKKVADTKDWASKHLDELYEQFKTEAEKRGAIVHYAHNAAEANEIIAKIAKAHEAKIVVKSKSMTAEETLLNDRLFKDKLDVVETDLGEWIIQLRNEGPSHMVMPAIHLSRYQIAEDFSKVTGEKLDPEDVQKLVKIARIQLRKKFNQADIGVTGANFCVAENGTFAIAANECNERMVTSIPGVHIAIAGLDKLVPNFEAALNALYLLPRNATGQRLTSNVTWFNGAYNCESGKDGKKELHIVLLDNGRKKIAQDPLFSQVFRCVRCGACANVCPVFRMVGGHKMGHIYIGAIGLILTYFYHSRKSAAVLSQNCIGCESCKDICAGGIDLPKLIHEIRERCQDEFGSKSVNVLAGKLLENRKVFHSFLKAVRFSQAPVAREDGFVRHLPDILFGAHQFKSLPTLAKKSFRELWEEQKYTLPNPRMKVAIFAGCVQDFIYPEQLTSFVELMKKHNVQVDFNEDQNCCGLPLKMLNQDKIAKKLAITNTMALNAENYDAVVTLCASCASHLKHGYADLLGKAISKELSEKVSDFSSFMKDKVGIDTNILTKGDESITYHAPCHQCRGLGVVEQPHDLISAVANYEPSPEERVCCGFGGSYSAKFPEISQQLLEKKIENIKASGVKTVVTDCPGCLIQIKGGMHKRDETIKVKHIVELLNDNSK